MEENGGRDSSVIPADNTSSVAVHTGRDSFINPNNISFPQRWHKGRRGLMHAHAFAGLHSTFLL